MTSIRSILPARALRLAALAAATCLAGTEARSQSTGRLGGDVSVRTGYSTNPFLNGGDDSASLYGELALSPRYTITEATASTDLMANLRLTQYLREYGRTEGYSVSAIHSRQLDERTDAQLSLNLDSSVLGEREILLGIPGEPDFPDPSDPNNPPGPDVPLIGTAQRTTTLSVGGTVNRRLTAVDNVSLSASASRSWYNTDLASDYRNYNASAAYRRNISERSSVGVTLRGSWTAYSDSSGPSDSTVYSPQITYRTQLSSAVSLDAALGGQFIRTEDGRGDANGFSGNVNLCRNTPRSTLCLTASRDATSSGIGGVRQETSAILSYSYRLAEYDTLQASVSYSRYGASQRLIDSGSEYVSSNVSWERRFSERLLGGANLAYRDAYGPLSSGAGDVNFQIYVRYSLGQLR